MRKLLLAVSVVVVSTLVAAGCDWTQNRYGPEHTGSSPDTSISVAAITGGQVQPRWSGDTGGTMNVVVAGGRAYSSGPNGSIVGFDAAGVAGCSGIPKVCAPRWSALPDPGAILGDPLVADGVVVTSEVTGRVSGFDATGATSCTGEPVVCTPLWTADGLGLGFTGTAAGGVLYRSHTKSFAPPLTGLAAYDIAGVEGCSGALPAVCTPMWTADVPGGFAGAPAVARGIAYVASSGGLRAFDAAGTINCGGAPKTCAPLWTGTVPGAATPAVPVTVANGLAFVSAGSPRAVVGFDAAGLRGCSGAPKTCVPVWVAEKAGPDVAVANGKLYTRTQGGLGVYDATGSEKCSAAGVCRRLWRYPDADCAFRPFPCDQISAPAIANGVVYRGVVTSGAGPGLVRAYDATGTVNCAGNPKVCSPIGSWPGGNVNATPVVANRFVYSDTVDGHIRANGLP